MNVTEHMPLIYMLLSFNIAFCFIMLLLTGRPVNNMAIPIKRVFALYMLCEFVSIAILAVVTGPNPRFNINDAREYIVWSRIAMLFTLGSCNVMLILNYLHKSRFGKIGEWIRCRLR